MSSGWSTWHDSSHCSVSCGGGYRTRIRSCHSHHRTHEDHQNHDDHRNHICQGPTTRTETCNTQPCPGSTYNYHLEFHSLFNYELINKYFGVFFLVFLLPFCPQSFLDTSTACSACPPLWKRFLSFSCFHSSYEQLSIVLTVQLLNIKLVHHEFSNLQVITPR